MMQRWHQPVDVDDIAHTLEVKRENILFLFPNWDFHIKNKMECDGSLIVGHVISFPTPFIAGIVKASDAIFYF